MTSEQKEAFLNSWFGASEGSDWTHGMAGSFVEIINAQFDQAIQAYTRAEPDVPELVRYRLHWSDFDTADMEIDSMEGEYVLHSQAAEIIAAEQQKTKDAEELAFRMDRFAQKYLRHMRNAEQRAEAAEAKLAQYEEIKSNAMMIIKAFDPDNDLDNPEKFNAYHDLEASLKENRNV